MSIQKINQRASESLRFIQVVMGPRRLEKRRLSVSFWRYGRWVESAVGSHLLAQSFGRHNNLYYWREGNHEVDFVVQSGDNTIGLEVKSGRMKSPAGIPEFSRRIYASGVVVFHS